MFGRGSSQPTRSRGTFGGFLIKNAVLLGFSFVFAFFLAGIAIQYFGFFLVPFAALLAMFYPPLGDAFWVTYITIYGLLSIIVMFFRFKTGSRI